MGPKDEQRRLTRRAFWWRTLPVVTLGVMATAALFVVTGPIPQPQEYHSFADQRTLLGIPHCLNVVSNIGFLVVGALGLGFVYRHWQCGPGCPFLAPQERWPFLVLFLGIFLTAFGSGYYHADPNDDRLVWDRLPMAVAFMAYFAVTIAERVSLRAGTWLIGPLVALGVGSVLYWHVADDLRPYVLVQSYPLLAVPLILLLFPARYTGAGFIWGALGWYLLAKVFEVHAVDHGVFELGHVASGHTLKHLAAAMGTYSLLRMLRARESV
jgi:hypothetical protein